MDAIEKQQSSGQNASQCRTVCKRHFSDSDFTFRGQQKILKLSAIPSIFENQERNDSTKNDAIIDSDGEKCGECILLENKITELKKQLLNMNVEKQKLELKIQSISEKHKKLAAQLAEARKAFSKEKQQKNRLTDLVEELKAEHFISPDDEKFLNVSHFFSTLL